MNDYLDRQSVKGRASRSKHLKIWSKRVQRVSLVLLVWMIALGCIYGLYDLVFESALFTVRNIEVEGNIKHVSQEDIVSMAAVQRGSRMYSVDLKKVQERILANPWVKEVAVTRKLPSTIWIFVNENVPAAFASADDLYIVDEAGKAFKKLEPSDRASLPVLTGVKSDDDIAKGMSVLKAYSKSNLSNYFDLAEVNVDAERGYSLVLAGYGVTIRVGFNGIDEKLERFYNLLGAISAYKEKMRYVDLNIPGKVAVKYGS